MNSPAGMRPISAIKDDIDTWIATNTHNATPPGDVKCKKCNAIIQQTTLYASVHDSPFEGCVGSGDVMTLALPYCPTCEPNVPATTNRTCIHELEGAES